MLTAASLFFGTLVSEDLACITAGVLIQQGRIGVAEGVAACVLGIFAGDVGLWGAGRYGGRLLDRPWIERLLAGRRATLADSLMRHAGKAILASRFLPGSRLPLYVAAGAVRVPGRTFALWALLAAGLWTPPIVLAAAAGGGAAGAVARGAAVTLAPWILSTVSAGLVLVAIGVARRVTADSRARTRLLAGLERWRRWEFWPMWLFYAPVALWVGMLALRYRGLSTLTAANPAIPDGGTVGESKLAILKSLPAEWIVPTVDVPPAAVAVRLLRVVVALGREGWAFPLVLKPDVGQRGTDVKLARTLSDVRRYLERSPETVLVQPYHPGPFEAGIFYYRMPGEQRGRILSITDKHFPVVVGDGRSTVEELIWAHPRYRLQAATFLERHRARLTEVLADGERLPLALAGNHCQGTLFKDGGHLLTPALERRIDQIAHAYEGFFVGRFDVRYRTVQEFRAGRDLAIVELNGATAESTNIYDPDRSLLSAYRLLFRQWSLIFAIGAENRRRGAAVSSFARLWTLVRAHAAVPPAYPISD